MNFPVMRGTRLTAAHGSFLSDDEIRQVAPSVFAETAHGSRSRRFEVIPTSQVLSGLRREGFEPVQAMQSRTRDETRGDFTKHMLRLRRRDALKSSTARKVGDVYPEAVLVNANDGSSAYTLSAGLFRLVCLNGMTVSERSFGGVRVTHTGDVLKNVVDGTYTVLEESKRALDHAEAWQGIMLTATEQHAFARSARTLRFGDANGNVKTPITAEQLLGARRTQDGGASLWAVFNRVQENVIRGGLHAVAYEADGRRRNVSMRAVNGIGQDMKLNRALWRLAETLADRKAA